MARSASEHSADVLPSLFGASEMASPNYMLASERDRIGGVTN
jgi:hypothetical protein